MEDEKTKEDACKVDEPIKQLELQLHEQFAQNYNNVYAATATMFCTMLAVLAGYGAVLINVRNCFAVGSGAFGGDNGYTLDALVLVTIASLIVLFIIKYICLYQGVNQRLEQFIVFSIRKKYYREDPTKLIKDKIFPKSYHPFEKRGFNIIVGIYGKLIPVIIVLQIIVYLLAIIKVVSACCCNIGCFALAEVVILCGMPIADAVIFWLLIKHEFKKYYEREEEYKENS